jgi:hypothetical protein
MVESCLNNCSKYVTGVILSSPAYPILSFFFNLQVHRMLRAINMTYFNILGKLKGGKRGNVCADACHSVVGQEF